MGANGIHRDVLLLRGGDILSLFRGREQAIVDAVKAAYLIKETGDCSLPNCAYLRFPDNGANRIIPKPAFLGGPFRTAGIKWVASFPGNLGKGIERASATLILNCVETGLPEAVMESSVISAYRTAASAALAADTLHVPKAAKTVGLVGCGLINFETLRFLVALRPEIERFILLDTDRRRAEQFGQCSVPAIEGRDLTIAQGPEELLGQADLISIATNASEPHLGGFAGRGDDLTVLHISLRDLTPAAILASDNVVDDVEHVCSNQTSLELTEKQEGNRRFIRTTLGAILCGAVHVREGGKPVVFSPFGLAVLDIAVAHLARVLAQDCGAGLMVGDFVPQPWMERAGAG
jgi:2,3-diaminopropionate biosynthesis protein SbnB